MRGRSGPGWREAEQTAIYLDEVADFFEHVAEVPPLVGFEDNLGAAGDGLTGVQHNAAAPFEPAID